MSGFKAATVVEPLDYDFSVKAGPGKIGTIPEPSDAQIDAFSKAATKEQQRLRRLIPDLPPAPADPDDLEALAAYQSAVEKAENAHVSADVQSTWKTQARIFSALCSGELSEAELLAVPRRIRLHFCAWLYKEVVNPEVGADGGGAQVLTLPSSAVG